MKLALNRKVAAGALDAAGTAEAEAEREAGTAVVVAIAEGAAADKAEGAIVSRK